MRRGILQLKLVGPTLAFLVLAALAAFGQQPPKLDPFDMLITSAASFDIDSPVTARAEFDPPVAVVGQRVVFRVEVSALDESLKVPDQLPVPAGLEFHPGGHGQMYQPTGSMKLQPRTTYLFHVTATNAGSFTMPQFEVLAYGKPVKVPAATLTLEPKGATASYEPPGLQVDLPPGEIYAGQLVRLKLVLPDAGASRVLGFNKARIEGDFIFTEPAPLGARRDNIQRDGKIIPAFLAEVAITPLRAGRLNIVAEAYAFASRPIAGQTNVFQIAQMLVDSDPISLQVKELPAQGKLPGFTGAVGVFTADRPILSMYDVRAGDPLTLTVTVRGEGNIGHLTPPPAPELRDWQTFPPTGEPIAATFIQQRGYASFNYTMIPLSDQIKTTPAIPFSYFDPVREMYVDLTIPPVPLTVTPGSSGTNTAGVEPTDAANTEREPVLTGLAKEPGFTVASLAPLQQRTWFLLFQIVPAAALGGLWFWDSRRRFHALHPEVRLKRRARRGLRRELRHARRAAAAGNAPGFAASAANALREACAPHSAANPNALVCTDVLRELPAPESKQHEIVCRLFAAADALRFGNAQRNGQDLLALKPDLERLLEQMKERL